MKKLWNIIKEKKLVQDMVNVIVGAVLVVILVLFCLYPDNIALLMAAAVLSGFVNILNGFKKYLHPASRMQGMGLIIVGMVIWAVGIYLLRSF